MEKKKEKLITMYQEVENDLKQMHDKGIFTTAQFISWYKYKCADDDSMQENKTLELIYDWYTFYQAVKSKNEKHIDSAHTLTAYLKINGKGNFDNFFEMYQIEELGLNKKDDFKHFNSAYGVIEDFTSNSEEKRPHSLRYIATALNALELTGEDLLSVAATRKEIEERHSNSKTYCKVRKASSH